MGGKEEKLSDHYELSFGQSSYGDVGNCPFVKFNGASGSSNSGGNTNTEKPVALQGNLEGVFPNFTGWANDSNHTDRRLAVNLYVYNSAGAHISTLRTTAQNNRGDGTYTGFNIAYDWENRWFDTYRVEAFVEYYDKTAHIGTIYHTRKPQNNDLLSYNGNAYVMAGGAPIYVSNFANIGRSNHTPIAQTSIWNEIKNAKPASGTVITAGGHGYQFASGRPYYIGSWGFVNGGSVANIDPWAIEHPSDSRVNIESSSLANRDTGVINGAVYAILKRGANMAVDIPNGSTADGVGVQLHQKNNTMPQLFRFEKQSDGTYKIININSNKALNIPNGSMKPETQLIQWTSNSDLNERFYIVKINDHYRIISAYNGMCLDMEGNGSNNGTPIKQYFDNNSDAQKFTLVLDDYGDFSQSYNLGTLNKIHTYLGIGIEYAKDIDYIKFVPSKTGDYVITSSNRDSNVDPLAKLYNSSKSEMRSDDDGTGDRNFKIVERLEAGKTYYIAAQAFVSGTTSGWYTLNVFAPPTIKYELNDDSGMSSSEIKTYGVNFTLPTQTRIGYTFKGWSTSSAATSATYQTGAVKLTAEQWNSLLPVPRNCNTKLR